MNGGIYLGPWAIANRLGDTREALERRARHDARLTADLFSAESTPGAGFLARLRGALPGQPQPVDGCATCAA